MKRILFDQIIVGINVEPVYFPEIGIIFDKSSNQWIYHFNEPELFPYFYFALIFDDYKYTNYYLPNTGGYNKKVTGRIFNIYLIVNINYIIRNGNNNKILFNSLQYYFLSLQIKKIKKHKMYNRNINDITKIISHRNNNPLFIYHWHYFKINKIYLFNLSNKNFTPIKSVPKIFFKKTGGIIETNNVPNIVTNIFINNNIFNLQKTLIILPKNMSNLWSSYEMLTYEQLFLDKKNHNLINIKEKIQKNQPTHIIIHECYESFLPTIKLLLNLIECNNIWIINSLSLKFYFSNEININKLSSLSNIWINFNLKNKQIYKNEIIKLLLTSFHKYYFRVNYATINISHELKLSLSSCEINMMFQFKNKYKYWRDNLDNHINNIYSCTTKKQNYKLETKIFNAFICLISSVISEKDLYQFFIRKIDSSTNTTIDANSMLKLFLEKYKKVNNSPFNEMNILHTDDGMIEIQNKINKMESIISNYTRYSDQNFYSSLINESCSICYDNENIIKTRLICGHSICLDCILNTIARYNKCPICNEYISINKIAIIRETIEKYHSNLIGYIKQINKNSIIITNLDTLVNLLFHNSDTIIININNENIYDKIKKINTISQVIIFTSNFKILSNKELNNIKMLVNYFMLFNHKPKIIKINIDNYNIL